MKDLETIYENMIMPSLGGMFSPKPVVTSVEVREPIDDFEEVDSSGLSQKEICKKIIKQAKKLRRKIGADSYHYIRSIISLAEQLQAGCSEEDVEEDSTNDE